jgi:hypothetical protein
VKHRAAPDFWAAYRTLSPEIQELVRKSVELLKSNPRHPSLHLKQAGRYYSVRIGRSHRAIGILADDEILWIWIGDQQTYERLLQNSARP